MPKSIPLPTLDQTCANLRAIRAGASPAQVTEGRAWYPAMGRLIRTIADEARAESGDFAMADDFAIGVFAAFSQNATWKANVTMASRYLSGAGQGGMASVMREIEAMEDGTDPREAIGALKRPDFYSNLRGDLDYVTCDRWHLRAAFPDRDKVALTPAVHALVTEATRIVAAEYGEAPASCQAVIWCAIRPSGDGK